MTGLDEIFRPVKISNYEKIILPIKLSNGNSGRGFKWYQSARRKKEYAKLIRLTCSIQTNEVPVRLVITRILGPRERLWDADSIGRGSAKELIDAMVECWWFYDDSPKWIHRVDYEQDANRRSEGPAVEVAIFPC